MLIVVFNNRETWFSSVHFGRRREGKNAQITLWSCLDRWIMRDVFLHGKTLPFMPHLSSEKETENDLSSLEMARELLFLFLAGPYGTA